MSRLTANILGVASDEQSDLTRRGLAAVSAVPADEGLRFAELQILRDRGNLLVHLAPAPVVARVATLTGTKASGTPLVAT